jgi:hypothetical protein
MGHNLQGAQEMTKAMFMSQGFSGKFNNAIGPFKEAYGSTPR